jgi:hypothetical protein
MIWLRKAIRNDVIKVIPFFNEQIATSPISICLTMVVDEGDSQ